MIESIVEEFIGTMKLFADSKIPIFFGKVYYFNKINYYQLFKNTPPDVALNNTVSVRLCS